MENVNSCIQLMGSFAPTCFLPEWMYQYGIENFEESGPPTIFSRSADSVDYSISSIKYFVSGAVFQINGFNYVPFDQLLFKLQRICDNLPIVTVSAIRLQRYIHYKFADQSRWTKINNMLVPSCPWQNFDENSDLVSLVTNSRTKLETCNLTRFVVVEKSREPGYDAYISVEFFYEFDKYQTSKYLVELIEKEKVDRLLEADNIIESIIGMD